MSFCLFSCAQYIYLTMNVVTTVKDLNIGIPFNFTVNTLKRDLTDSTIK